MPNWCVNKLIMTADDPVKIREVLEFIQKDNNAGDSAQGIGTIDFSKIVPEPTYENNDDWYNWRVSHWSTKWNATNCRYDSKGNSILFHTAWAPPCPVIKALSIKFPKVSFTLKYTEAAIWFAGVCEFENGEMVVDDAYDVSERSDDQASEIFQELLGFDPLNPEDETKGL